MTYNLGFKKKDAKEMSEKFFSRRSVEQVEEGTQLAPKFDSDGLIPVITTDYETGEVLIAITCNDENVMLPVPTSP